MFESLRSLSDQELITRTEQLTARERKLTLSVLVHLHEIERRQLFLKRGYPTLFEYCTSGLGYSTGAAWRRIEAARCMAKFPEVYVLLESSAVNLSTISQVAKLLTQENKGPLLARIQGRTQREVEAIAAEYEPKLAVPRDRVRTIVVRVPAPTSPPANFRNGNSATSSSIQKAVSTSDALQDRGVSREPPAGEAVLARRALVQFSASETVMAKLQRVRAMTSHRLRGNATLEGLVELLADFFLERQDPALRHTRREKRMGSHRRTQSDGAQRVTARVRDHVFVRDKQQCSYVGPTGKRCASTHVLQIDHIEPVARGGASTIDNLRLLCAYHNRLEAERLMGRSSPHQ